MKLKICWMYHDIMDLYGDKGNMMVLEKRCNDRDIEIEIDTCAIGEDKDLSTYHLVFLGGGADKEQKMLMHDLLARKNNIQKAMDEGTFFFLVCGGYQLFGQYYISADNERIEGLHFFDYYTTTGSNGMRCIGNIAISCILDEEEIIAVGFENHGGQTCDVISPLGTVLSGYGNRFEGKREGFYNGQVFATYMHGPLLPKNPKIADFIIYKSLKKEFPDLRLQDLKQLDDRLENQARDKMLERLGVVQK